MTAKNIEQFRTQLLAKRSAMLEQIATLRGGHTDRAEAAAEQFARREDSDAQVATERDLNFAMDEHETAELMAIEAALARLNDGSYGECTDCGINIPAARLQATPEAVRCVHCQEKVEKHARGR